MPYLSFTMAEAEQQVRNIPVHSMHPPVGAAQESMPLVRLHNLRYLHLAAQFCLITKRARIIGRSWKTSSINSGVKAVGIVL